MKRIILFCSLLASFQALTIAQEQTPTLRDFFQQRLAGDSNTPPSYEALLRVTDTIAGSDPKDITAALPSLSAALTSDKDNLAVEAAFALSVISHRPDGGALLRTRVPEIGALLDRTDDRLSGGSLLILQYLTPSTSDLTVPIMIKYLSGPTKPNLVKADIVSTLLKFKRNDPQAIKAVETFLGVQAEPQVQIATLQALGANHISTAGIDSFAVRSLDNPNKYVKVAAIRTAHALGSEAWSRAMPAISRLAVDPAEDREVRAVANKELKIPPVTALPH